MDNYIPIAGRQASEITNNHPYWRIKMRATPTVPLTLRIAPAIKAAVEAAARARDQNLTRYVEDVLKRATEHPQNSAMI